MTRTQLVTERQHDKAAAGFHPWKRLAGAVLMRAVYEAKRRDWHNNGARRWLMSGESDVFFDCLEFDRRIVRRWVSAGCPRDMLNQADGRMCWLEESQHE